MVLFAHGFPCGSRFGMGVYFGVPEIRAPKGRIGQAGSSFPAGTTAGTRPGACTSGSPSDRASVRAATCTTGCRTSSASPRTRAGRTAGGPTEVQRTERAYCLCREASVASGRCPDGSKVKSSAGYELYAGEGF